MSLQSICNLVVFQTEYSVVRDSLTTADAEDPKALEELEKDLKQKEGKA